MKVLVNTSLFEGILTLSDPVSVLLVHTTLQQHNVTVLLADQVVVLHLQAGWPAASEPRRRT